MQPQRKPWEGTLLLFVILATILIGVAYNVGYVYKFPVPWLAILIVSALIALGSRYWPRTTKKDGQK